MAGHSKFKNIMYRKGAQDAKRAKLFTKLAREITVAVKEKGEDLESNPRLRLAIAKARAANMPKDNIERAIKKATSGDDGTYEEVRYEGYGIAGIAVIVEALTDNRNRTGGSVRAAFTKYGGALGETGSSIFSFDHIGEIKYKLEVSSVDDMLEAAIEAGAEDCTQDEFYHIITTSFEDLGSVTKTLEDILGTPDEASAIWSPHNLIDLNKDKAETIIKMINILEDDDDVQNVFANFNIPDDIAEICEF